MQIGTAEARAGETTTGYVEATELPTDGAERLPVVVAEGTETDRAGYVLSRHEGATGYENDPLLDLAVADDDPLVVPRETEE